MEAAPVPPTKELSPKERLILRLDKIPKASLVKLYIVTDKYGDIVSYGFEDEIAKMEVATA